MPPLVIAGAIGAAGSLGGALIGKSGATSAANTQAGAANYAAQLQKQAADAALAEQRRQFNVTQGNLSPYLNVGRSGLANLSYLLGLLKPTGTADTFQQPTGAVPDSTMATAPNVPPTFNLPGIKRDLLESGGVDFGRPISSTSQLPQTRFEATPGGTTDLASLVNPSIGTFGELAQPFNEQFTAPTNITEQNDPGFQARLAQGQQILERSAAARGGALSGGTLKDLNQFAQDYASNEYGNVYNRAFNQYATRYNQFKQNQADLFNRYASLAGIGQTSASTLGTLGSNNANNISNILLGSAGQIGQQVNNAAAARASGYAAGANSLGGAVSGTASNIGNLYLLSQLLNNNPAAASNPFAFGGG